MDEKTRKAVQQKIDNLPEGAEFGVKDLMGEDWESVSFKQGFGRDFKAELGRSNLTGAEHARLENSPRHDVYRKK